MTPGAEEKERLLTRYASGVNDAEGIELAAERVAGRAEQALALLDGGCGSEGNETGENGDELHVE